MHKTRSGFTIVELLIVIVVIGILAAIMIVAYNGIQNRANESVVQSDLAAFHKKVSLYNSEFGNYPKDTSELATIRSGFTKSAYYTANEGNVTYCASTNGAAYLLIARGTNGKRYYIGSNDKLQEYTGAYGTPSAMCSSVGLAYAYGAWGYELPGWGSPGWKVWTSAS